MNKTSLNASDALRIASFDGGGPASFSQLKAMEVVMHRLKAPMRLEERQQDILPCQYFHMMGGSDAGGLIVIMLVKLRMSVKDTIAEFANIVQNVYPEGLEPEVRTSRLRECMQSLLIKRGLPQDMKMEDDVQDGHCVGFVVAALRLNVRAKVCLRTYPVKSDLPSGITVIDAALATCASQPEFLPVQYGEWYERQTYVGASLGANNPVRKVITEARSYFAGESRVSVLLSLGSGHPGVLCLGSDDTDKSLHQLMFKMTSDSEQEAQDVGQQMAQFRGYFRFSVENGMEKTGNQDKNLEWVTAQTISYLGLPNTAMKLDEFIDTLSSKAGTITLRQLAACIIGMPRTSAQMDVPEERTVPATEWHQESHDGQHHNPEQADTYPSPVSERLSL